MNTITSVQVEEVLKNYHIFLVENTFSQSEDYKFSCFKKINYKKLYKKMLLLASILVSLAIANCAPVNENNPMEGEYLKVDSLLKHSN